MDHEPNQGDPVTSEPVGNVPALAKAEDWLSLTADHPNGIGDHEALIYLRSRGRDCHSQVTALIESWKEAEQVRLDKYAEKTGRCAEEIRIENISQTELRDFWKAPRLGEYSTEASMLRIVDWCGISWVEPWWRRLAKAKEEAWLRGGVEEPAQAAYWLFNIVRSDYAIELMPRVLRGYLRSLSLAGPDGRAPWITECDGTTLDSHLAQASTIVFSHSRLGSRDCDPELLHQATNAICKGQEKDGAWRTWTSDDDSSIESTAMALHALALAQPRDWPRIAAGGRDWLWSKQGQNGFWTESGTPGPAHLTVLVLDAIALANGDSVVTFRRRLPESVLVDEAGAAASNANQSISEKTANGLGNPDTEAMMAMLTTADARRAAIESYQEEVLQKTSKRVTKKDIWSKAGYKTRSEFERWQRHDKRATTSAHRSFCRILATKPHLT